MKHLRLGSKACGITALDLPEVAVADLADKIFVLEKLVKQISLLEPVILKLPSEFYICLVRLILRTELALVKKGACGITGI
jgi:hypothetical protein